MRCPQCETERSVERHITDPPLAIVVATLCPNCASEVGLQIDYFDADGNQVFPDD
jgi:hypothetical protein